MAVQPLSPSFSLSIYLSPLLPCPLVPDNKSLNNTDSNIKPKVWVETGQMHQKSDIAVHLNENEVHDDHEVG